MSAPTPSAATSPTAIDTKDTQRGASSVALPIRYCSTRTVTMPVKLAVATMARLIPPASIVTIMPSERKAMIGSWYAIEMAFPEVGNRWGFSADMRTTMTSRIAVSDRFSEIKRPIFTAVP